LTITVSASDQVSSRDPRESTLRTNPVFRPTWNREAKENRKLKVEIHPLEVVHISFKSLRRGFPQARGSETLRWVFT